LYITPILSLFSYVLLTFCVIKFTIAASVDVRYIAHMQAKYIFKKEYRR